MESELAKEAERALVEATQRLSPEERLNAFLVHCRLVMDLHEAGQANADHRAALKQIEKLMSAKANTADGDTLDVLVTLVEAYERKHYPLDFPGPA